MGMRSRDNPQSLHVGTVFRGRKSRKARERGRERPEPWFPWFLVTKSNSFLLIRPNSLSISSRMRFGGGLAYFLRAFKFAGAIMLTLLAWIK